MKIIDIRSTIPRHKTKKWNKRNTATHIVVHCTAGTNQNPNVTAKFHIESQQLSKTGAPSIAYTDFIDKQGTLYHCNSYSDITWHAGSYNTKSIGVVLAYPGTKKDYPTTVMMDTLETHLTYLCIYLHIDPRNVIGHREIKGVTKNCPGPNLDLDMLRSKVTMKIQRYLANKNLFLGAINGIHSEELLIAIRSFIPAQKINWTYSL